MKKFLGALSHAGWALFVFTALAGVFLWRTGALQLRLGAAGHHDGRQHAECAGHEHAGAGAPKCEHGVATIDCDNCRFEVGAVKVRPDVAKALLKPAKVEQRELARTLRLTGSVQLDTSRVTDVTPPAAGRLIKANAHLGQAVKKGDVLAVIHSGEFGEAKAAYLDAYTRVELARKEQERQAAVGAALARLIAALAEWRQGDMKADPKALAAAKEPLGEWKTKLLGAAAKLRLARSVHDREKALVEKQVGTRAELEQAEQELHTAEAELAGLLEEAQLNLKLDGLRAETAVRQAEAAADAAEQRIHIFGVDHARCADIRARKDDSEFAHLHVLAPMAGTVTAQHVTEGRYVKDETTLFTLADLSNLWVWCNVYERDLGPLHAALAAGKPPHACIRVAAFGDEPFCGSVDLIGSTVDEHTRTVRVRVQVDNSQGKLRPGMFASVEINLGAAGKAALVPRNAVLSDEGTQFVFQEIKDGLWLRRDVKVGRSHDGLVEIVSGLDAGATVAAGGAFMLKSDILRAKMGAG